MLRHAFRHNRKILVAVGILGFALLPTLVLGQAEVTIFEVTNDVTTTNWGGALSTEKQRIGVIYNHSGAEFDFLCAVNHKIRQTGSPTDAVTLTIRAGGTIDTGTLIATTTVDSSDIPTSGSAFIQWRHQNCFVLEPATFYNFVWTRGGLNSTDKYQSFIRSTPETTTVQPYTFVPASGGWILLNSDNAEWSFKLIGFTDVDFAPPFTPATDEPLRNIFPFAFFYDIKEIIDAQATSTEGAFPTLALTFFSNSTITTTTEVLSTSTLTEFIGTSNIDLIKDSIRFLMWALFAIFVFTTVKNLFHR